MSLAVIKKINVEGGTINLTIDTGTNKFYYLKIGKAFEEVNGIKWISNVVFKTNLKQNNKTHPFFDSCFFEKVEISNYNSDLLYVQLFTFKDKEGKSPCYSKVLQVRTGIGNSHSIINKTLSMETTLNNNEMQTTDSLKIFRTIPHSDNKNLAMQNSFEDLLAGIIRVATPLVTGLINGLQNTPVSDGAANIGTPALGMFNTIIDTFLRGINNTTPNAAPPSGIANAHSLSYASSQTNDRYAKQFIFGIDDAIIASLAGPILEKVVGPAIALLPQLVGSHNQVKLQNRQMNNRLVTDLVSDVNRRMILQQFLQSQQAAGNNSIGGANIGALLQLLQQGSEPQPAIDPAAAVIPPSSATAPAAPAVIAPIVATTHSLDFKNNLTHTLSDKAMLSFVHIAKQTFFGKEKNLFQFGSDIVLKLKFNVIEPAPKAALQKAIITITFKDNQKTNLLEKTFKQKDILPNTTLVVHFTKDELQKIPINECIIIVAEMRWITNSKRVFKILGATEIVFVKQYYIKEKGKQLNEPKELTEMNIYRSFWNKIWESPVMDKVKQKDEDNRKIGWELNGNLKYTITVTTSKETNGLMETKQLVAQKDEERIRDIIDTRMKSGIELSIIALNKMSTLWDKMQPLQNEKLEAFKSTYLEQSNKGEFIYNLKLIGASNQRGLIWIIPILKQQIYILAKPKTILQTGEIQETEIEEVQIPMPFAARILGLRSE